jgi:glycosyltransferase involved in cell wall biosynthesis
MNRSKTGPRVTFLLPRNYQTPIGGYKVIYEYANGLSQRGWDVTVSHISTFKHGSYRGLTRNLGFPVRPSRPNWFPLDKSVRSLQWSGWNQFIPRHADAVVASSWETAECLGPNPRGLYLLQHYETWDAPAERVDATWRLPLRKLAISRWLADKAEELGAGPITIIPNSINPKVFNMDVAPEERSSDEVAMLWHDKEWKGSKDGLEALQAVKEIRQHLHVTLFSAARPPTELPAWISFVPNATQTQLRGIYNRAAVFVSPSHAEGWPLPPAESMACGAALVSTDIEGVRDYAVDGETALLAPIKSPKLLAGKIITLLDDSELRAKISRAGQELIVTKFSWNRSIAMMDAEIRRVLPPDSEGWSSRRN